MITAGTVNSGVNVVNDVADYSESKLSNSMQSSPGSRRPVRPSPDDGIGSSIQHKNTKISNILPRWISILQIQDSVKSAISAHNKMRCWYANAESSQNVGV